ncbi:hypothetical protein BGZ73_002723 [Actinomortierella ambigua]|nr:hypothetical protein BGZ73_002723 [Actinomortierella ambigua]
MNNTSTNTTAASAEQPSGAASNNHAAPKPSSPPTGTPSSSSTSASTNSNSNKDQQQQQDDDNSDPKKKRAGPKRRKVTHGRPCQRCIKRNIGHLCHDEPKPSQQNQQARKASQQPQDQLAPQHQSQKLQQPPQQQQAQQQAQQQRDQPPLQVQQLQRSSLQAQQLQRQLQNQQMQSTQLQQQQQLQGMGNLQMYGFNNQLPGLPVTPLTFASEHMGNEFNVISDFLESLGGTDNQNVFNDNGIPVNTTEKFFLTAANPSDGTNEDRLTQVINAKFEAGFLKPYNYVNGYSRLQKYMDSNMSNISRQRILNVMGTFRPAFRSVAQSLTDIDLVLVEEAFERLLLDYDRVFSSMGIPACLWRRTGEIYKGNKEFAALVNVPLEMLREGRLCIYELMAEESAVNYWEKYGNIAFDAGQKAVLTSCLLKNPDPENQNLISCCFSFTIRRDKYNIPTVIVGNFLPVSLG